MALSNKKSIALILIVLTHFSCKTWGKTLQKGKVPVKNYWMELVDGRWDFWKQCNIAVSEQDVPNLKLFPIKEYEIDSTSIMNYDGKPISGSILKLNKADGEYILLKDTQIISIISAGYKDGKWFNLGGYGCLPKSKSDQILNLQKQGDDIFYLRIYPFPTYGSSYGYIAWKKGHQFCVITQPNHYAGQGIVPP